MVEAAKEILEGAYDLHVHSAPDVVERRLDDIGLAREARKWGMAGLVIKNHIFETASRASIARRVVEDMKIHGGIVLNYTVGGLNPHAVEACLELGGKVVWMPTIDARNHRTKTGRRGGISLLNEKGRLREPVGQILELIKKRGAVLATGHLSLVEIRALVSEAKAMGVQKIVLTHPEFWITRIPIEAQKELVRKGVFIERCYYSCTLKGQNRVAPEELAHQIREVGPAATILASDLGQKDNPPPPEGLKNMVEELLQRGLKKQALVTMLRNNPRDILD